MLYSLLLEMALVLKRKEGGKVRVNPYFLSYFSGMEKGIANCSPTTTFV